MKIHELKTWPEYFDAVERGDKTFELRKNDRNFEVGDRLVLKRFDPEKDEYTGEEYRTDISYILEGAPQFGLAEGVVILGMVSRYQKDVLEAARSNHMWLNAFSCVRPTDEFRLSLADSVLHFLDSKSRTIMSDFDDSPFESLKQQELILRLNKS